VPSVPAGAWLDPIQEALDSAERPSGFFFRDDDIGWGGDRLWQLLDIFAANGMPADLAVIPNQLTDRLAGDLRARTQSTPGAIGFHQHGFAHANHEPTGRKYEFGPSRSKPLQLRDIAEGRRRMLDLLGDAVDPIFTPPWNRCTRDTGQCIVELGFQVLSREARATPLMIPGLEELPIRIDWFAHRKGIRLSPTEFGTLVATAVREGPPIGVMFHHAVMDADERAAASEFLALIARHPTASASPMRGLCHAGTD
jgi:peptidoglycan/xylan/chitin deacetylase (PgdA/CDA1 family)